MNEIFEFYKRYSELENVLRKGWLMRNVPVSRKESDSDHTLQTILLADLLIRKYNIQGINLLRVLEMLLIHEIGETIIGDISMIEEDYEKKKQAERDAVRERLSCLGEELAGYYFGLYVEFEERKTREAQFAYCMDKIDPVFKAKQYDEQFGVDLYFKDFAPHAEQILEDNEFFQMFRK